MSEGNPQTAIKLTRDEWQVLWQHHKEEERKAAESSD